MNNLTKAPHFITKEFEEIEKRTSPFVQKMKRYALLSFVIIPLSVFNIVGLLFNVAESDGLMVPLILFSILGAFGFALQNEVKHHLKKVQQVSIDYMVDRIKRSRFLSDMKRRTYIERVQHQPKQSMQTFATFLEEEQQSQEDYTTFT